MAQGWESPDGSRSVVFARGVASAIRAHALEGFHSLPRRGAEVGGLLLGRVLRTKPLLARITGFEDIPCSHAFGPSYILSEEDKAVLEAALQRERPDPVIGFVRSYTGRDMVLDEVDGNLLQRYFPADNTILLLLEPRAPHACRATFLFPEHGEVGWEPQYAAFDFSEARLAGEEPAAAAAPAAPPVVAPPAAVEPVETRVGPVAAPEPVLMPSFVREAAPTDAEPPRKRGLLLPLAGWILLCVAAAGVYELWTMARAPRWAPLGLTAQIAPGGIHLAWNQGSRAAHDAARGILMIDDAALHQRIPLTAEQVRAAAYDYHPASSNVLFRLELYGPGLESAGDSLEVVSSAAPLVAAAPPAASHAAPPVPNRGADRATSEPRPENVALLPEPLREIHPDIPAGIRARIAERVVVPVEVTVAASGRVSSASAHGSGDGLYQYLADRARQAAMQWRFSPAKAKNGKAVPATRTVYFVFTSGAGG